MRSLARDAPLLTFFSQAGRIHGKDLHVSRLAHGPAGPPPSGCLAPGQLETCLLKVGAALYLFLAGPVLAVLVRQRGLVLLATVRTTVV